MMVMEYRLCKNFLSSVSYWKIGYENIPSKEIGLRHE
jgi:hypothetical protein